MALPGLRLLSELGGAAVDLLFPPTCGACRATLPRLGLLCAACAEAALAIVEPLCSRCGLPGAAERCPDCVALTGARSDGQGAGRAGDASAAGLDLARARYLYGGPVEEALVRAKFGDAPHLAVAAGLELAAALDHGGPCAAVGPIDMVTVVPIGRARLRQRGYDQAALMAGPIARALERPLRPHLLRRTRETAPQTSLDREQRRVNVRGAFAARGQGLDGARVLLIDDVLTTGATVDAAATALKAAGARRVEALTLARAPLE